MKHRGLFEKLPRAQLARWAGWYFLGNAALLALVSARYFFAVELPPALLAKVFSVLATTGHFASFALLASLVLLPLIVVFPRKGVVFAIAETLMALVLLIVIVDTFVFAQYRFHMNRMVFELLTGGAAGEIFQFSAVVWALFVLAALACIAAQWWLARMTWTWVQRTRGTRYGYVIAAALASVFVTENVVYAWADASAYTAITKQARVLPAYAPLTAKKFFDKHGLSANAAEFAALDEQAHTALAYPTRPMQCGNKTTPMNIVFIVIDAWRADALAPDVTPNLDRLAQTSLRFDNHFSGGNSTRTGLFSLMYGVPGTYWHAMLAERRGSVLIDEVLRRNYQVGVFGSANLTNPEFDRTIFASVKNLRVQSRGDTPASRDQDITNDMLKFLDGVDATRPMFGFLFYDSPHGYDFPPNYKLPFTPSWDQVNYLALTNDSDPVPFHNRYKNAVHYVDDLVGAVLDKLQSKGILERTLVVVTGDHGQEFNDNKLNYWGHGSNFSAAQTQVPLIVHWPGKAAQRYTHQTTHFDVVPTLMQDVLGCANDPRDYSAGQMLTANTGARVLLLSSYEQFAVIDAEHTAVVDQFGDMETVDARYRPTSDKINAQHLVQVMDEMARFYKK